MSSRWSDRPDVPRGQAYDERWTRLAAAGADIHGEAGFVDRRTASGATVLDAGCGTGRVAIELARRGHRTVGVDLDPGMLGVAREKAPGATWVLGDLATLDLGRRFEVVLLAGNVLLFVAPGTECQVMARCADHLEPGGLLVTGFSLYGEPGRYQLADLDGHAAEAGLVLVERFATWDEAPFTGGDYAVSVFTAGGRPASGSAPAG